MTPPEPAETATTNDDTGQEASLAAPVSEALLMEGPNIWTAAQLGDLFRVQTLVKAHPELAAAPNPVDQVPALHWAALNNRVAIIRYLLEVGASVNALGGEQWSSALHWAVSKGHLSSMAMLLGYGADVSLKDQPGYTPLHIAAQHGQYFAILYLLALGVPVDERDSYGRTALLWAAYRGHTETVQVLLQEGASPDAMDNSGTTILQWAIIKGAFPIVRMLLTHRVDPTVKDEAGKTAADWAKEKGHWHWYSALLIEAGRKNLVVKELGPLSANYWRQSKRFCKIMMGRVVPALFLPAAWLALYWLRPWFLGLFLAIGASWVFGKYIRPLFFPSVQPMETAMMITYQLIIIPMGILLEIVYLYPAASSHWILHLVWALSTIGALFFLRKVNSQDPGVIKPAVDKEARRRLILELVADGELTRRKYCITCRIKKPLRSKHCRVCDVCVAKFDHHCPWTNCCVGVGNHRTFILYVYCIVIGVITYVMISAYCTDKTYQISVLTLLSLVDLSGLNLTGVAPSPFCILGSTLCRQAAKAPFIFIFFMEKILFTIWIGFLLVTQSWQIAKNKTTNEMSNEHRLEYFMMDTAVPDGPEPEECANDTRMTAADGTHRHGPGCQHGARPVKTINPFDRGLFGNCSEFCLGAADKTYFEMHEIPPSHTTVIKKAPVPIHSSPGLGSAKVALLINERGEHLV